MGCVVYILLLQSEASDRSLIIFIGFCTIAGLFILHEKLTKKIQADPGVEVEVIMAFTSAISPTDSDLFIAIEEVTSRLYPNSTVVPSVSTGFTDSHFTRDLGIASYGFNPLIAKGDEFSGVHGNDEKVNENAFRQSVKDLIEIISAVVYN